MTVRRVNTGYFSKRESLFVHFAVCRLPRWITPDHLTAFAAFGALMTCAGLICCWMSGWFLLLVFAGLAANWVGDSLDGALARYRKEERHRVGFLLDRTSDVLSFFLIIVALGLSPYMTHHSSLMLLLAYLLHTIYTVMRIVVDGVHHIGLGGIGATEGRTLVGSWAAVGQFAGRDVVEFRVGDIIVFDVVSTCLLVGAFCIFAVRVASDVRRIGRFEGVQEFRRPSGMSSSIVVPINRAARSGPDA